MLIIINFLSLSFISFFLYHRIFPRRETFSSCQLDIKKLFSVSHSFHFQATKVSQKVMHTARNRAKAKVVGWLAPFLLHCQFRDKWKRQTKEWNNFQKSPFLIDSILCNWFFFAFSFQLSCQIHPSSLFQRLKNWKWKFFGIKKQKNKVKNNHEWKTRTLMIDWLWNLAHFHHLTRQFV